MSFSGHIFFATHKKYQITTGNDKDGKPVMSLVCNHPDGKNTTLIHQFDWQELCGLFEPLNVISKQLLSLENTLRDEQQELDAATYHDASNKTQALQRFHDAIKTAVYNTTGGLLQLISDIQATPEYMDTPF